MGSNTPNLNLYKASPKQDGESTFNIDTMLNDNWDKIDEFKQEYNKLEDEVLNPKMAKTEKQVTSIINLPNAVDGQASVGIEGRTVTNLLGDGSTEISVTNASYRINLNEPLPLDKYLIIFEITQLPNPQDGTRNLLQINDGTDRYPYNIDNNPGGSNINQIGRFVSKFNYSIKQVFWWNNSTGTAKIKNIMIIKATDEEYDTSGNEQELLQKYPYISGIESTTNTKIRSVGKNLFDSFYKSEVTYGNIDIINDNSFSVESYAYVAIQVSPNKKITLSCKRTGITRNVTVYKNRLLGHNANYVMYYPSSAPSDCLKTFFVDESYRYSNGKYYITFRLDSDSISEFMLNYGDTATPYEPYKESISYITLPEGVDGFHSLSNGVKDEVTTDGKLIKRVKEYVLQESDITRITTGTQTGIAVSKKFPDAIPFNAETTGYSIVDGRIEKPYNTFGLIENNIHYATLTESGISVFYFAVMKSTTLEQAQQALVGTKIIYQLAQPQIYDLTGTPVTCFKDGTIYIESVDNNAEYVLPETQFSYPINTAGALNSNTMAINQLSNQYQLTKEQQLNVSNEQKLQMLGQQITQLKLGGMQDV